MEDTTAAAALPPGLKGRELVDGSTYYRSCCTPPAPLPLSKQGKLVTGQQKQSIGGQGRGTKSQLAWFTAKLAAVLGRAAAGSRTEEQHRA